MKYTETSQLTAEIRGALVLNSFQIPCGFSHLCRSLHLECFPHKQFPFCHSTPIFQSVEQNCLDSQLQGFVKS